MTPLRVVSPYRAQAPESGHHHRLIAFDWPAALAMLAASVTRSCGCDTVALTDDATDVGTVPAFRYPTSERRLMLWILEVSLAYVSSPEFDRDTVFVSPDTIVRGDLRPYFAGDVTILVRSGAKYVKKPILNSIQWWPVASRARLVQFYTTVLQVARDLPDNFLRWGADSEAIRRVISPIAIGIHDRAGVRVHQCEARSVLYSIAPTYVERLESGRLRLQPPFPIIDFKGQRKLWMARYVAAISGVEAR